MKTPPEISIKTENRNRNKRGSTLIVTVSAIATIAVLIGITADLTGSTLRVTERSIALEQARAAADASLELAYSQWRAICRSSPRLPKASSEFVNIQQPTIDDIPALGSTGTGRATINSLTITAVDPVLNPTDDMNARREAGMNENTSIYSYLANARATVATRSGNVTADVSRVFRQIIESPWSYAIFFEDDLEMHPGPPQRITGPVHSNKTIYAAHNTLTYEGRVTSAERFVTDYAPGDKERRSAMGITGTLPNYDPNLPPSTSGRRDALCLNPSDFDTSDSNPNNDGYRELIERPVPGFSDPLGEIEPSQRLYTSAALKIIIEGTETEPVVRVFRGQGNSPTEVFENSPSEADKAYYNAVRNAITTGHSIYDRREASPTNTEGNVGLTTLDIDKLRSAIESNKIRNFESSSVLYFSDQRSTPAGPGAKFALRLVNGKKLPSQGLTVASDLPIYVQGDYNTGNNPPSNSSSTGQPEESGYTRKPAAIVGDAVNILSNNWSDSNSGLSVRYRKATPTTVNAGIISGNVKTTKAGVNGATENTYSGGSENFPRFLEDWNGVRFTYYGSMIQLYQSKQATGTWGKSDVYVPPVRNWFFDVNFRTNPPPGFLVTANFERGIWLSQ